MLCMTTETNPETPEPVERPRRFEQMLSHEAIAYRVHRVTDFNARMEKRQMPGRVEFTYDLEDPHRFQDVTEDGVRDVVRYPTVTELVGDYHVGEWTFVGMYDWIEDSAEAFRCHFPEGFDHDAHGVIDYRRCDHCGVRTRRRRVFVIASQAEGVRHVGGSCVKDYTGHNPYTVLRFWDAFAGVMDDPEWGSAGRTYWLTREFVEQAAAVVRVYGFKSSGQSGATIGRVYDSLNGVLIRDRFGVVTDDCRVPVTDEDRKLAAATLAHFASISPVSDFDRNAKVAATVDLIHNRTAGIAAFLPEGYLRHLGKEADRKAKADAEAKRNAEAQPTPEGDGPHTIVGVVTKRVYQESYHQYGTGTYKITVRDDRGFTVWGSEPSSVVTGRGDRVRFVCSTVVRSDRDEAFGFFKRPRRFEITEQAPDVEIEEPEVETAGLVPAEIVIV